MSALQYFLTLGIAAGLAFLLVLAIAALHALCHPPRRSGFTVQPWSPNDE